MCEVLLFFFGSTFIKGAHCAPAIALLIEIIVYLGLEFMNGVLLGGLHTVAMCYAVDNDNRWM